MLTTVVDKIKSGARGVPGQTNQWQRICQSGMLVRNKAKDMKIVKLTAAA